MFMYIPYVCVHICLYVLIYVKLMIAVIQVIGGRNLDYFVILRSTTHEVVGTV